MDIVVLAIFNFQSLKFWQPNLGGDNYLAR
jgi:hypothetical protein